MSARRWLSDLVLDRSASLERGTALADAPVLAEVRSPLWTDGRDEEFLLVAGKVQNLRVAALRLDGTVVPGGAVFSFWRQVGPPWRRRGFAVGREVVAGCVVPTVGGGLCQISNALASAAARGGVELLEVHRHSARLESAPAPGDVDATVAWRHVDLRLRAGFDWRIEVQVAERELCVRIRAVAAHPAQRGLLRARHGALLPLRQAPKPLAVPVARGCLTCDETQCFRHRPWAAGAAAREAVLLDAFVPELADWLAVDRASERGRDVFVPWLRASRRARGWPVPAAGWPQLVRWLGVWRMVLARWPVGEGARRQAQAMRAAERLAWAYSRELTPLHTHLVLSQSVLVPLWRRGVLGGRRVTVYLDQLPAADVQACLDAAALRWPASASLRDFRVDAAWVRDEESALAAAACLVTAHEAVARALQARGLEVQPAAWHEASTTPAESPTATDRIEPPMPVVVLACSALARKGLHEFAAALQQLGRPVRVRVLGSPADDPAVWRGLNVERASYASPGWSSAAVAVLPAHVEHAPRAILAALAAGVPAIATRACGLPERPGLRQFEAGDVAALVAALRATLELRSDAGVATIHA